MVWGGGGGERSKSGTHQVEGAFQSAVSKCLGQDAAGALGHGLLLFLRKTRSRNGGLSLTCRDS